MRSMTTTEKRQAAIYSSYRRTLRSYRSSAQSRDSRTSSRKQDALAITADRYKSSISEVKKIVRTFELADGITHEHTDNYLEQLRIREALNLASEASLRSNPDGICEDCGFTADGKLQTAAGKIIIRGAITTRLNYERYLDTGELTFEDLCYPCHFGYKPINADSFQSDTDQNQHQGE